MFSCSIGWGKYLKSSKDISREGGYGKTMILVSKWCDSGHYSCSHSLFKICSLEGPISKKDGNFVLSESGKGGRPQKGVACWLFVAAVRWQGLQLQDPGSKAGRTLGERIGATGRKANTICVTNLTTKGSLLSVNHQFIYKGIPMTS